MTMLRFYQPARSFAPVVSGRILKNLVDQFFDADSSFDRGEFSEPRANTVENEKEYLVELFMPGVKKEQIKVDVEKNTLTVSSETNKEEEVKYSVREFASSYKRSFTLPEDVNSDNISASYENGVLKVTLPKVEKAPEIKKQIEIR